MQKTVIRPVAEPFTEAQLSKLKDHLNSKTSSRQMALFGLFSLGLRSVEVISARLCANYKGNEVLAKVTSAKHGRGQTRVHASEFLGEWVVQAELQVGDYIFPSLAAKERHVDSLFIQRVAREWIHVMGCKSESSGRGMSYFRERILAGIKQRGDLMLSTTALSNQ